MKPINYNQQSGNNPSDLLVNSFHVEKEFEFLATPNNHFELIISPQLKRIGRYKNSKSEIDLSNSIVGINVAYSSIILLAHTFGFHIRLSAQQLKKITDIPLNLICTEPIALEHIFGKKYFEFLSKLGNINNRFNQYKFIQSFLIEHIKNRNTFSNLHIIDIIKQNKNILSVHQIQEIAGFSERSLERYFQKNVGISPREYLSIERFNQLIVLQSNSKKIPLLSSALDVGYYDQSHFIRNCKKFTGLTPEKYFKGYDPVLSGTYNTYTF